VSAVLQNSPTRSVAPSGDAAGWEARLELEYAARGDRTVAVRRRHSGPLTVQKPFYPEGAPCHVYVLHPPGGIVGGDRLELAVDVRDGGHALLTTPASTKFYRSAGPAATQVQRLSVAAGAALEWLPQDTILFDGCRAELDTRVDLALGGVFIGWEVLCLGRPASGEAYARGRCRQRLELWRDNSPLLLERAHLDGGEPVLTAPWGLAGHGVTAMLVAAPANRETLDAVRETVAPATGELFGATLVDDVLVCRYLGAQAQAALRRFESAWRAVRPLLLNRPACPPRIWRT
jgi:urease accessory protein